MKAQLEQRLKAQEQIPSRPKGAGGIGNSQSQFAGNLAAHQRYHSVREEELGKDNGKTVELPQLKNIFSFTS